jgi:hypothetical protein
MNLYCDTCGQPYGRTELTMVDFTGLQQPPSLCPSCARAWNDSVDRTPNAPMPQHYDEFKKGRRTSASGA